MKNRFVSLACVVLAMSGVFGAENAFAQDTKAMAKEAQQYLYAEDWDQAIKAYQKLADQEKDNALYHSQLGKCYLQKGNKAKAIEELQKAQSLYTDKEKAKDAVQYEAVLLAHTQKENDQVDDAIKTLEAAQTVAKSKAVKATIEKEIEACKVAKDLKANPKDNMVLNLGAFVNGGMADHSPVLTNDKKQLIFASRREVPGHSMDSKENQYDENVFVSTLVDSTKTFGEPKAYEGEVNTNAHDAVIAISPDGTELYIYREDDNGSILVSKKSGNEWSTPVMLNENINTPYKEKGAALSPDGKKLYFASDRPGTFGGLDIFVSEREGDNWGPAKNLGAAINTDESEEGPFVSKDGSTLYFSSRGHQAMGGYDLFKASINGDSFGEVENLGTPINSSADELYVYQDGQKLYFSSNRGEGQGNYDLYVAGPTSVMKTAATSLNVKTKVCGDQQIIPEVKITDNSTGQVQTPTPSADGLFTINGFRGHNYTIDVKANGNSVYNRIFDIAVDAPAEMDFWDVIQLDPPTECKQIIAAVEEVNPLKDEDGTLYDFYVEIKDITFEFAKADPFSSNADLDKLAQYLKDYPKAKVEVRGYADAQGSSSLNYTLARKRALTAQSYLTKKGVKASQIKVVSLGEENPLSFNLVNGEINESSKQYNRRLEFKMIQQGEKTMLIRAIRNIPAQYQNPDYKRDYVKKSGMPETTI